MKLSSPLKALLGLATASTFLALAPFLFAILSIRGGVPPGLIQLTPDPWSLITAVAVGPLILTYILVLFYIVHMALTPSLAPFVRIITVLGLLFLPFLTMPAYFFAFVLPSSTPGWALSTATNVGTALPPAHPRRRVFLLIVISLFLCIGLAPVMIILVSLLGPYLGAGSP
jgi:hypothetical protein